MAQESHIFLSDGVKDEDLQRRVCGLRLCAYPPEINDWTLQLECTVGSPIVFYMIPGEDATTRNGRLLVTCRDGETVSHGLNSLQFPLLRLLLPVWLILKWIVAKGRDCYKFTEQGGGSRYWYHTFIMDLELATLLAPGSAQLAQLFMSKFYDLEGNEVSDRPLENGLFYDLKALT